MADNVIGNIWDRCLQGLDQLWRRGHRGELRAARTSARSLSEWRGIQSMPVRISIAALIVAASGGASAQIATPLPSNARAGSYGSGWECVRGFQRGFNKTEEGCVAVSVPPNAYLDASGSNWECN